MDLVAFALFVFVVVPIVIGLVVGESWAYLAWATLVVLMSVIQALSGEVQFFTVIVVIAGAGGAAGVAAGIAGRRFLRRRAGAGTTPRSPERP